MNKSKYAKKMEATKRAVDKNLKIDNQPRISIRDKKVKLNKKFVEMQMFSAAPSVVASACSAYLGFKSKKFMDNGTKAMETIVPQLQKTLDNFNNVFEKCSNAFFGTVSVVDFAVELIASLLQVTFAKTSCKIASLIIELVRLIKKYVNIKNVEFGQIKDLIFGTDSCKEVTMQIILSID